MSDRHTITATLIVLNEARRVPAALASVAFCDEIVVVDSGSTDGTQDLARAAGARVIENPWPGFGAQRNVGANAATCDWILEVDADETITPALAREIVDFLSTPGPRDEVDILALPMRHRFLGAALGPAAQYPNYRTRMFRRGRYLHDEGRSVHEGLKPRTVALALRGDMTHELASSWREAIGDMWRYTKLEASTFDPPRTARAILVGMVARPAAKAGYRLVVDGAWRDGWRGLVKVALDAGSDAIVWARVLRRGPAAADARASSHFGEVMPVAGPPRIVAVATDPAAAAQAADWLRRGVAAGAGTDSELLVPPGVAADGPFFLRTMEGPGPLALARALSGTVQVRHIDAFLLADPVARRAHHRLAGHLRGLVDPLTLDTEPSEHMTRLTREPRPAGP